MTQQEMFLQQFYTMRAELIKLVQQRTQFIAEREPLRFRYITSWRASLNSVIVETANAIEASFGSFSGLGVNVGAFASDLFYLIAEHQKQYVPMRPLNGAWGHTSVLKGHGVRSLTNLNQWGKNGITELSPIEHWLKEPLNEGQSESTLEYFNSSGNLPYLISAKETNISEIKRQFAYAGIGGRDNEIPIDESVIEGMMRSHNKYPGSDEAYQLVVQRILQFANTPMSQGKSYHQILLEGLDLYTKIYAITIEIFRVQKRIFDYEDQIKIFFDEYRDQEFFKNLVNSGIYEEVENISKSLNSQAALSTLQPPLNSDVSQGNSNTMITQNVVQAIQAPEKKKFPLLPVGAAAAALYFLTRE